MSEVVEKKDTVVIPSKVTIKGSRKNAWLPDGHDGSHRFSKTAEDMTVQVNRHTGVLETGLSLEVEKVLETKLRLTPGTLSRYNKEFWGRFKLTIPQKGVTLNPKDNPQDELTYRVMLVHQEVANSIAGNDRGDFPFARYVMHSEEEEVANINKVLNIEIDALKRFGEMSETQMIDFLKVYGKTPGRDASLDFIKAQVYKIVKAEPEIFLSTVTDHSYKVKIFIKNCLEKGVLKESGGKFLRPGGEALAYSEIQLIDFLQNKDNSEVVASIKAQLQAQG